MRYTRHVKSTKRTNVELEALTTCIENGWGSFTVGNCNFTKLHEPDLYIFSVAYNARLKDIVEYKVALDDQYFQLKFSRKNEV